MIRRDVSSTSELSGDDTSTKAASKASLLKRWWIDHVNTPQRQAKEYPSEIALGAGITTEATDAPNNANPATTQG